MSTMQLYSQIIINGHVSSGELHITHDREVFHSDLPEPDPNWIFTDSQGHFHAYNQQTGTLEHPKNPFPTLERKSRYVSCCNGGCTADEGHNESFFVCRICNQEITPETVIGPNTHLGSTRIIWEVIVYMIVTDPIVSVRITTDVSDHSREWFGIAHVTDTIISTTTPRTSMTGIGPLGTRNTEH